MHLTEWGLIGLMALVPMVAVAETVYITDNLRLGLYEAEDTSGRPIRMLDSGQAMEILSRNRNYANVQLPDAAEGWVKAAYLVSDKPAKLIVAEITAERDALLTEIEASKQSFAAPAATIEALRSDALALAAKIAESDLRMVVLEQENASIQGLKERYKGSLPLSWVGLAMAVCLIAGCLMGLWWVDRRSRLRHGGIRIY